MSPTIGEGSWPTQEELDAAQGNHCPAGSSGGHHSEEYGEGEACTHCGLKEPDERKVYFQHGNGTLSPSRYTQDYPSRVALLSYLRLKQNKQGLIIKEHKHNDRLRAQTYLVKDRKGIVGLMWHMPEDDLGRGLVPCMYCLEPTYYTVSQHCDHCHDIVLSADASSFMRIAGTPAGLSKLAEIIRDIAIAQRRVVIKVVKAKKPRLAKDGTVLDQGRPERKYIEVYYPSGLISRGEAWNHLLENPPPGAVCRPYYASSNPWWKRHNYGVWGWGARYMDPNEEKTDGDVRQECGSAGPVGSEEDGPCEGPGREDDDDGPVDEDGSVSGGRAPSGGDGRSEQ